MNFSQNLIQNSSKFFLLELDEKINTSNSASPIMEIKRDPKTESSYLVTNTTTYALTKKELANTIFISKLTSNQNEEVQAVTQSSIVARKYKPNFNTILEDLGRRSANSFKTNTFPTIEQVLEHHIISRSELLHVS